MIKLFTGPPLSVCPPIDKLKKGTKLRLTFELDNPTNPKIVLVRLWKERLKINFES